MSASATNTAFPWTGLITLGAAIFIAITSEFLPTGLLPEMAEGLDVSRSSVGLLVTVFAGTVVVTAAALASLTRKLPRKPLLLVVLVVFAVSNFIAALAPSYEVLLASRVLGALAHGLFWAVAGAYPSHLVHCYWAPARMAASVHTCWDCHSSAGSVGVEVSADRQSH